MAEDKTKEILEDDNSPILLEGEFSFERCGSPPPEMGFPDPDHIYGFKKGDVLLGIIYKHGCAKWVYQHCYDCALTIDAIKELSYAMEEAKAELG